MPVISIVYVRSHYEHSANTHIHPNSKINYEMYAYISITITEN